MYKCECGKEFEKPNSFNGHKSSCKIHQINKHGSLEFFNLKYYNQAKKISQTLKEKGQYRKEKSLEDWISEKHTCEKCGKVMTEKFGSGRFCSRSCANSHVQTEEINKKRGQTYLANHPKVVKDKKCLICGDLNCENPFCKDGNKLAKIKTLIRYFGFNSQVLGSSSIETEWNRIKDMLYSLYWNEGKSTSDIARMFNYPSPWNLSGKVFVYLDIPRKNWTEAAHENYLNGKLGNPVSTIQGYKSGWHTTWNGKQVYLRSSYEFDYAKELDSKKIDYEVESLRLEYWDSTSSKLRIAVPDFYIPSLNLIVEIKSDFTLDKKNMIDKASRYIELGYKFYLFLNHQKLEFEDLINLN